MSIRTQPRLRAHAALNYHRNQRDELVALAWRMVNDGLETTRGYRDLQAEIQRHERLIAAITREFGGAS